MGRWLERTVMEGGGLGNDLSEWKGTCGLSTSGGDRAPGWGDGEPGTDISVRKERRPSRSQRGV